MTPFGILFLVLGSFAALCNLTVIIVFISERSLRSKAQLFIALAVGDVFFCLGIIFTAVHNNYEHQTVNQTMTVLSCWAQPHWIFSQIGPYLCMTMTLALTLERACAVFLPYWYKTSFKRQYRFIAIAAGCVFTLLHSAITFLMAINAKNVQLDTCARIQSSRKRFSMMSIILIALSYVFCFFLNVFSYYRARAKCQRINREMQRIKLISWISFLSMMSIVVPFSFLVVHVSLLSKRDTAPMKNSSVILIFGVMPINSASNLFLYLWLKRQFRIQAKRVLCFICLGDEQKNEPQMRPNVSDSLLTSSKCELSAIANTS